MPTITFDRESCALHKKALDEHLPPEMSDVVMTVNSERTITRPPVVDIPIVDGPRPLAKPVIPGR